MRSWNLQVLSIYNPISSPFLIKVSGGAAFLVAIACLMDAEAFSVLF